MRSRSSFADMQHAASVRRLALALTHSEATADDVVQEVYLSAWRHATGFRGEGSARGWSPTITRNAARRTARRSYNVQLITEALLIALLEPPE